MIVNLLSVQRFENDSATALVHLKHEIRYGGITGFEPTIAEQTNHAANKWLPERGVGSFDHLQTYVGSR